MDRTRELENLILKHKALYYQGRPEISDIEFDKIEDELRGIDPKNKVLDIVGSEVSSTNKVQHEKKMLSLSKSYKTEDLIKWIGEYEVVSTFKIDGVSCSLIYDNGELAMAKTRGDGKSGENITNKVFWIDSVPSKTKTLDKFEIRGEIYCTEEDFFHLSSEMESIGLEKPTSQRNIVAGLISRKENLELSRYLTFKAFDVLSETLPLKTEVGKYNFLKENHFSFLDYTLHKNTSKLESSILEARDFMSNGDFQIDGLVLSYNDLELHDTLGETSHHPRYKMAFKFEGEIKETQIEEIIWSVSRNGFLTPVAIVKEIELSGAKIKRVTLHNYGMVNQFNLKKGDTIKITRSGEVIPKFLEVVSSSSLPFTIPSSCPVCESQTKIDDIRLLCSNECCPGVIKEKILNFIQKIGIDDLSSKRLDEFISKGLIKSIPDLYELTKDDLLKLDKFQEKLANKLILAIEKSKDVELATFLSSLGITGGAINKCEKIVSNGIDSLAKLKGLTAESLAEIDSFAEKSSEDFVGSVKSLIPTIEKLESYGFIFKKKEVATTAITGKKFCITGTLSSKRSVVEKLIRDNGGIVVSSVTKNTDFLVTNDKESTSSKFKKAKKEEIPIVSEEKLGELIIS
jgi:DNA ligase (NAD+)